MALLKIRAQLVRIFMTRRENMINGLKTHAFTIIVALTRYLIIQAKRRFYNNFQMSEWQEFTIVILMKLYSSESKNVLKI